MSGNCGLPNLNYHRITRTLDVDSKCTPESLMETIFSVTCTSGKVIEYTITDNVATITEEGYVEGSEVDIWLYCFRPSEGGGACQQIIVDEDETKLACYKSLIVTPEPI